jgi:hypothetical protein
MGRYAALKGVIDTAFDKYPPTPGMPDKRDLWKGSLDAGKQKGGSNAVDIKRTEVDRANPAGMVMRLVCEGTTPRVIIEALLDEIDELRKDLQDAGGGLQMDGSEAIQNYDKSTSPWSHFDALGYGKDVPEYLKSTGKIQNLNFSKRECEGWINDIWDTKEARENAVKKKREEEGVTTPLVDELNDLEKFLGHYYVKRKFDRTRGVEFAYNLINSVKKYSFDSDCRLFDLILTHQVSEDIRSDQILMLVTFQEELRRDELRVRPNPDGTLPIDNFVRVMRRVFSAKSEQGFSRLEKALKIETNGSKVIEYVKLLAEDEDGNQGVFCEMLRSQHLMECVAFTDLITKTIRDFCDYPQEGCEKGETTLGRLREAITEADPLKPRIEVNALMQRGANVATTEDLLVMEASKQALKLDTFLNRLRAGLLKKSGRKGGMG